MGKPEPQREMVVAPEDVLPRIGYVTIEDIRGTRRWPRNETGHIGNAYTLARVMREQRFPLEYFGPLSMPGRWQRLRAKAMLALSGKRQLLQVRPALLRRQARDIDRELAARPVDLLFGNNSRPFAELCTALPIVVWRDATFAGAMRVHRDFKRVSPHDVAAGHRMERLALEKCTVALFRTQWAADDAVHVYGVDPAKVRVLPTGGNLPRACPRERLAEVIGSRSRRRCELLFVGVDWTGKGGDVALAATRRLVKAGVDVRLTVLGADPGMPHSLPANTRVIDYINIFEEAGRSAFEDLLANTHFLIFPSRVDTFGNVLPEANAFGVPCLASNVAGLPEVIRDGVNGRIIAAGHEDEAANYAECIADYMADFDRYLALAQASYDEYRNRMAWDVVGPAFGRVIEDVVRAHKR